MKYFFGIVVILGTWLLAWCGVQTIDNAVKSRADFSGEEKMEIHMCLMGDGDDCDVILDPANMNTYGDAIREQCDLMSWMTVCDNYFSAF